jgi:hypothetical protein
LKKVISIRRRSLARTNRIVLPPRKGVIPCDLHLLRSAQKRDHGAGEIAKRVRARGHIEACAKGAVVGARLEPDAGLS